MLSAACRRALSSAATGKEAAAALRHTPSEEPLNIVHLAKLANLQPQPSYARDAAALLAYVRVLEQAPEEPDTGADAASQPQRREEGGNHETV